MHAYILSATKTTNVTHLVCNSLGTMRLLGVVLCGRLTVYATLGEVGGKTEGLIKTSAGNEASSDSLSSEIWSW